MSDRKDQDKGIIGGAGGNTATGGPGHSDAAGSGAEESELKARRREGAEKGSGRDELEGLSAGDDSVDSAMNGVDFVFHAAALKQVPSCDFFPMQAVYTNVIGSHNVIESAIAHEVQRVVCLSTDKAVIASLD